MRYMKPMMVELFAGARASGEWEFSCYSGGTPGGDWYLCETGGSPYSPAQSCGVGPAPGTGSQTMCISGAAVLSVCETGAGGYHDTYCTVGPSAAE